MSEAADSRDWRDMYILIRITNPYGHRFIPYPKSEVQLCFRILRSNCLSGSISHACANFNSPVLMYVLSWMDKMY